MNVEIPEEMVDRLLLVAAQREEPVEIVVQRAIRNYIGRSGEDG